VLGGRYQLIRPLGKGGMGQVYLAYDATLRGNCAVKELSDELARNARSRERFVREAEAAAKVLHTNIVQVRDIGTGERPYLVMEYLEGKSLRELLDEVPGRALPWRRAVAILAEIGAGLQAAHAKKVVHRDIKPGNIMMVGQVAGMDRLKIIDFGIACALDEARITGAAVVGTVGYMAPEQFLTPEIVDARADIHAFGTLGLELLMGAPPPSGRAPADAPMDLLAFLQRCRSLDREERPRAMIDVIDALDRIRAGEALAPIPALAELREPSTVPDGATARPPRVATQVLDDDIASKDPRPADAPRTTARGTTSASVPGVGTLEIVRPRRWPRYTLLGVASVGAITLAIIVGSKISGAETPAKDAGSLIGGASISPPKTEATPEPGADPIIERDPDPAPRTPPERQPQPPTEPEIDPVAEIAGSECPTAMALAGEWRFTTVAWTAKSGASAKRDRDLGDHRLVVVRSGCALTITVTHIGTGVSTFAKSARLAGTLQINVGAEDELAFDLELVGRSDRQRTRFILAATEDALTGSFERGGRLGWLEGVREDPAQPLARVEAGSIDAQPCPVQCRAVCSDDPKVTLGTCLAACQGLADATVATYVCRLPPPESAPSPTPPEAEAATCSVEYITTKGTRFSVKIRMLFEDAHRYVEQRCTPEGTKGFADIARCVVRCGGAEVFTHTLDRPPPPPPTPEPAPEPEVEPVVIEPIGTCAAALAVEGGGDPLLYTWPAAMSKAQCRTELEGGCVAALVERVEPPVVAARCTVTWNDEWLGERALVTSP
jgi:serine/threonine protein kinase